MSKQEKLEAWVNHLRNEHRIKRNVDYAYTIKFDQMHVMAEYIWMDDIMEHAVEFGVEVTGWFAYEKKSKGGA